MNARSLLNSISKSFGLTLLIWAAGIWSAEARESLKLRVAIEQNVPQINVGSSVNAQVLDGSQQVIGEIQGMNGFAAQAKDGGIALDRWKSAALWIVPKDENGVVWIGNRWYRGRVYLIPSSKGLTAINYVDLEQYLFSVLGSEMSGNWPQEALKAQAVAARSYALHERQGAIAKNEMFDLGDTQGWQVYNGIQSESTGTQTAVMATAGQVLAHNSQVINAVFHSSAGGCTENVEDVWVQPLPYLRSVKNDYDQGAPVNQWSRTFSATEIGNRFGVQNLQRIEPVKTTRSCGRVQEIRLVGDRGSTKVVKGNEFREALGLRSTLFTIANQPQRVASNKGQQQAISFTFNGRGFGHGLGMSQWGAYNMARRGYTFDRILQTYYLNTQIAPINLKR